MRSVGRLAVWVLLGVLALGITVYFDKVPALPIWAAEPIRPLIAGIEPTWIRTRDALDEAVRKAGYEPPARASGATAPAAVGGVQGRPGGAGAGPGGGPGGQQRPPVTVRLAGVERKPMPVRFEAIGTVTPLASVTIRSRVESQITGIEFADGANVKAGQALFRLDARQIDAQLRGAEAAVARNRAQLELADLDVRRNETLARQEATSQARLDTARGNAAVLRAQIQGDQAVLDALRTQRGYYDIAAPLSGRIGIPALRAGSIVRPGDVLVTINQVSPVYVAFPVPQRLLPDLRNAVAAETARVEATPQGVERGAEGRVALIDNAAESASGTIGVRALFENADETLWPGLLCDVRVILRTEPNALVVQREAIQTGQDGTFVFLVENGVARTRPVTVARLVDRLAVLSSGLNGGESVVVDGQSQLTNGARVVPAGAGPSGSPSTPPVSQVDSGPRTAGGTPISVLPDPSRTGAAPAGGAAASAERPVVSAPTGGDTGVARPIVEPRPTATEGAGVSGRPNTAPPPRAGAAEAAATGRRGG